MKMMTRAEKEGVRERGRQREEREEKKRRGKNTDMEPKHLCSCAKDFQDHKRLLVPRSKQALSRRSNHPNRTVLGGSSVLPAEELLVRDHHARQSPRASRCRLPRIESTPTRCSTSRQKFNLAKPRATGTAEQRLALPSQRHDPWCKNCKHVRDQKKKSKTV